MPIESVKREKMQHGRKVYVAFSLFSAFTNLCHNKQNRNLKKYY